jgi:hypothetical protein
MIKKKKKEKSCPTYAMPSGQGVPKITSLRLALGAGWGIILGTPQPWALPYTKGTDNK